MVRPVNFPHTSKVYALPDEVLVKILAFVEETSLHDLATVKECSWDLNRVKNFQEVFRRANLGQPMIFQMIIQGWAGELEPADWRSEAAAFGDQAEQHNTPYIHYTDALRQFIFEDNIPQALRSLDRATGWPTINTRASLVWCLCLLFSPDERQRSEGVQVLAGLKIEGVFDDAMRYCRNSISEILFQARQRGVHPAWLSRITTPICPQIFAHADAKFLARINRRAPPPPACLLYDADDERNYLYLRL